MTYRLMLNVLISLLLLAGAASAQTTTNTDVDLTGVTLTNACNGEVVTLSGFEHILTRNTSDGAGGLHAFIHNNSQGLMGTGATTGATYQVISISEFTFNAKPPFPSEFSFPSTVKLVGQGSVPNFTATFHFKATIDANGNTTAVFFSGDSRCQN